MSQTLDRRVLAALALLASCLGGCTASMNAPGTPLRTAPSLHAGWMMPRAKSGKGLLYVSDNADNLIDIFDAKGKNQQPIGQITDGVDQPNGVATDAAGNLYVANGNYNPPQAINVYPPGATTPSRTYTTGISLPIGVAVQRDGRLYVANFDGYDVTEYPKGSTTPDKTISFVHLEGNDPFGLVVDARDDLYVAALGYPRAQAYELTRHSSTPVDLGIGSIPVMHGIAVDRSGDVLVVDQPTRSVDIFPPGSTTPSKVITDGLQQPILITLDKREKHLYVADEGYYGNGTVRIFSYPKAALVNTITFPQFAAPFDIALSPS